MAAIRVAAGDGFLPSPSLDAADKELAELGKSEGRMRLRLGELLDSLKTSGGHRELGFSTVRAFVMEMCTLETRFCLDSLGMAKRIRERGLARVRAGLMSGQISFSMAELLSRHAQVDNEVKLLAAAREEKTVRKMRSRLSAHDPRKVEEEDRENVVIVDRLVSGLELEALEATRMLVELVNGRRPGDEALPQARPAGGAKARNEPKLTQG